MRSLPLLAVPEYRAVFRNGFYCFGPLLASVPAVLILKLICPETPTGAGFLLVFGFLIVVICLTVSILSLFALSEAVGDAIGRYRRYGYDLRE